jgi:2-dehydro-3-deoxy-L-rhamnonate dehydrogenase (NAD+)
VTRTALVTGAMSGMGAATVERLRRDGLRVVGLDVVEGADLRVDVRDADAIDAAVAEAGPFDVLVTCAGVIGDAAPALETTDAEWRRLFDINAFGTFAVCRAVIPGMVAAGWGRVVTISSGSGKNGTPRFAAYSASKGAVIALTKALGKELAATGVLINTIAPGFIRTPLNDGASPEDIARITAGIPVGRPGRPEEIAALASWLCSDEVTFSTGAVYDISGGRADY